MNTWTEQTPSAPGVMNRRAALRRSILFTTGAVLAGHSPLMGALAPAESVVGGDGLHRLAVGDHRTKGNKNQRAVADAMSRFATTLDGQVEAVLALGDNFYGEVGSDRFREHFEEFYSPQHLNCPFYACVGNHDYGTVSFDRQDG
jgi:tartrate-resistant acid phosphatase type 5